MAHASKVIADPTNGKLLEQYLTLSENQRDVEFLSTKRAAEITGMSQRTIQLWVESGYVQAVFIGRKCRVSLNSLRTYLIDRADERDGL